MKRGWEVRTLGEVESIEFLRGNGLSKSVLDVNGKNECIHYGHLYTIYKHPIIKKIIAKTNVEGKKLSVAGDVLIPGTTTADAMGIAIARSLNKNDVVLGGDINILRTKNSEILSDFLSYYINGPAKIKLASYANGTNILHLSNRNIKQIEIPIPPLKQQKQIVAKLDKCFTAIDKAHENTSKNLTNTKQLFQSQLTQTFTQTDKNWEVKKFGGVCKFVRGPFGGSLKKSIFVDDGVAVYEQRHAIYNQFDQIRYFITDKKFKEMQRFELLPNDLIMSCSGTMGKMAIVPKDIKKGIINQALLKLTTSKELEVKYLKSWMESKQFQNEIENYSQGAAIKNVASVKILKQISIPIPPLAEQKQIVTKLDALQKQTQSLESNYQNQLKSLEDLKKSLLGKAFSGRL